MTNNILFLGNQFTINDKIYVKDVKFTIDNSLLKLSATRGIYSDELAIFDAKILLNIPLEPDLNITYSVYLSKLNLATDAGRLYLHMSNGTNVVGLSYDIGHESPEYTYQSYTYFSYRIGNATDIWFNGTRNIWNDLENKAMPPTNSWKITTMVVGLVSYSGESSTTDYSMLAMFDLSGTYFHYKNFALATVDPASITFSWLSFYGLTGSTSVFCVWLAVYLKLFKRVSTLKTNPNSSRS
jgi:hypothetical protein